LTVGATVGLAVGATVGGTVGACVGATVGATVRVVGATVAGCVEFAALGDGRGAVDVVDARGLDVEFGAAEDWSASTAASGPQAIANARHA